MFTYKCGKPWDRLVADTSPLIKTEMMICSWLMMLQIKSLSGKFLCATKSRMKNEGKVFCWRECGKMICFVISPILFCRCTDNLKNIEPNEFWTFNEFIKTIETQTKISDSCHGDDIKRTKINWFSRLTVIHWISSKCIVIARRKNTELS